MEVILISIFSAIIVFITIFSLIKVFIIAYRRNEISKRKFIILGTSSIIIGTLVASVLPFVYSRIFDYII